jgi:sigma-B regulation protein RsbU (phosphoserine phosphatase)
VTAKILVVDDEPDVELLIRQRYRKQIGSGEYAFVFARNGEEALRALERDDGFEVVLTDLNMPVMDGLALLDNLVHLDSRPQPVVVSAYGDLPKIRAAMNRGAFDFLTKPIDFQDLDATVRKSLEQVRVLKEASRAQEQVAALRHELTLAQSIQQSILPREFPDVPGADLYARMLPARNVGGDFYDFFSLGDSRLGVVIGDVSGKGVPAAIFMALCRTLLRSVASRGLPPGDALGEMNHLICADNRTELFVTVFYGVLDLGTGRFDFANGGHNRPYLFGLDGRVCPLPVDEAEGTIVGLIPEVPYTTASIQLRPGDGLLLYTDGVTEATDRDGRMYSERGLEVYLHQAHDRPATAIVGGLVDDVGSFIQGAPQTDDLTALAVRYAGTR